MLFFFTTDGEDQLATLRRAMSANLQKIGIMVDALCEHIRNAPYLDPRPVENCLALVSRALIVPTV